MLLPADLRLEFNLLGRYLMKKTIGVLMVFLVLLSFGACGFGNSDKDAGDDAKKSELSSEEEAARIKKEAAEKKAAEQARKKAEEEARKKAEEEARRKAAEELKARTFFMARDSKLYDSEELNEESAVPAPHKGEAVVKREVYVDVPVEEEKSADENASADEGSATDESTSADENASAAEGSATDENTSTDENAVTDENTGTDEDANAGKELVKPQKTTKKLVAYELESLNGEPSSAYIKVGEVYKERFDFIDIPQTGVSYEPVEKKTYEKNPPIKMRGVYVTRNSAVNGGGLLDYLIDLAKTTDINAFVIDVKDDSGLLLFKSEAAKKYMPAENDRTAFASLDDAKAFIKRLKDENIYLVARIVTFKSPQYAQVHTEKSLKYKESGELYSDSDGIYWSTPYGRELWDYNISLAEEAADLGFNEIQFDYVRFPATSENEDKILEFHNEKNETKTQAIYGFLKEAYARLSKKEVYVTADIFGWMCTAIDDQNIGQHWESLVNLVDYSAPMMYPSHYGEWNYGLPVPDAQPYECIDAAVKDALSRNANLYTPAKLRPWIQDFTASWVSGHISYGANEVGLQIKALKDNGVDEYMLWNAGNSYSDGALHGDKTE